jgi:hypothetical protein
MGTMGEYILNTLIFEPGLIAFCGLLMKSLVCAGRVYGNIYDFI